MNGRKVVNALPPSQTSDRGSGVYLMLFAAVFGTLIFIIGGLGDLAILNDPLILLVVGLAAFRGGRAISHNQIFSWLREPFTQLVNDSSGAGQSVEPRGRSLQRVVGELLCCPICSGTWVALVLSGLLVLVYPFGLILSFVLAAAGLADLLHWHATRDEWQGRASREDSGTAWLFKNRGTDWSLSESKNSFEEDWKANPTEFFAKDNSRPVRKSTERNS